MYLSKLRLEALRGMNGWLFMSIQQSISIDFHSIVGYCVETFSENILLDIGFNGLIFNENCEIKKKKSKFRLFR